MKWKVVRILGVMMVTGLILQGENSLGMQKAVTVQAAKEAYLRFMRLSRDPMPQTQ